MFHWNQSILSMKYLLRAYQQELDRRQYYQQSSNGFIVKTQHLATLLGSQEWDQQMPPLELLHEALEHCDAVFLVAGHDLVKRSPEPSRTSTQLPGVMNPQVISDFKPGPPHDPGVPPMPSLDKLKYQKKVLEVISIHLQEVVGLLNEQEHGLGQLESTSFMFGPRDFRAVDEAAPEDAPAALMNVYFNIIRPKVTREVHERHVREGTKADPGHGEDGPSPDEIWCIMVFRMICWLSLHTFDENDVQMSQSALFGSRVLVSIA